MNEEQYLDLRKLLVWSLSVSIVCLAYVIWHMAQTRGQAARLHRHTAHLEDNLGHWFGQFIGERKRRDCEEQRRRRKAAQ